MMIFLADGRLGNQIFQYVFLKTIQKNNERIVVSGFEDLLEVFDINDVINLNKKNRWIRKFLFSFFKPVIHFLSEKKVISSVSVNHETVLKNYRRESTTYTEKQGFFKFVTFVKLGFFQSEVFFNKNTINNLKIKNKYLIQADNFLFPYRNKYKVFVHIRRDDYKDFTIYGQGTLLPIGYFKEQIRWFESNRQNCFFIFLSDEPESIKKEFDYLENKLISNENHFGIDLTIMTQCQSAILSPSSFGWWGSYFMRHRDVVFGPKYWLGFNSKVEFHKQGVPSYVIEVEI